MTDNHLAWHETMELHELVAFQYNSLVQLKKTVKNISDRELKELYKCSISKMEKNLKELLPFFPKAPHVSDYKKNETPFYAGSLLGLMKTAVRSYSIAITETATPHLRRVLVHQLNRYIRLHYKVFQFMYQRGYYPSYNLNQLLQNDVKNTKTALELSY